MSPGQQARPLDGVRVLDVSNLMAAPMATMYLADFGAEVIKAEHPQRGDELRQWGRKKRTASASSSRSPTAARKTITLNLSTEGGQDLVRRFVPKVDVLVENYRPGTMERWGLGWDELSSINPSLVMARVTGYGQTGPYREPPRVRHAGRGVLRLCRDHRLRGRPTPPAGVRPRRCEYGHPRRVRDHDGPLPSRCRRRRGGSSSIWASTRGSFTLLGPHVVDYDQAGAVQRRSGSRIPHVAPRNTYQTSDGRWVAIAGATKTTFERICQVLSIEDVLEDPRFADNQLRVANVEALDDRIQVAIGRLTLDEVLERFDEAEAPVGPAHDISGIFDDPQYEARENIVSVTDDELGPLRMQSPVPRLSRTPGRIDHAGPPKGAHNSEVYGELLDLTEDDLRELAEAGAV